MEIINYFCPYCGGENESHIDASGDHYETIEDCTVCCRPILIRVECDCGQVQRVEIERA
jgi:hypothetical protein